MDQNTSMKKDFVKVVIKLTLFLKTHHRLPLVKRSTKKETLSGSTRRIIKIFRQKF